LLTFGAAGGLKFGPTAHPAMINRAALPAGTANEMTRQSHLRFGFGPAKIFMATFENTFSNFSEIRAL
jgi:hypothetical protein